MTYKTFWLAGLLAPMLVSTAAVAVQSDMVTTNTATLFIDKGAVYGIGYNNYGMIAPGSATSFSTPFFSGKLNAKSVAMSDWRSVVLYKDGTADHAGLSLKSYAGITSNLPATNITDVAVTLKTVYYVADGTLFSWTGESGDAPIALASGVSEIATGDDHLVALFTDGSVSTLGANAQGQLGNGTFVANPTLTKVPNVYGVSVNAGKSNSLVLQADGTVIGFGKNSQYEFSQGHADNSPNPVVIPDLDNVVKVSSNAGAVFALIADGTVKGCGWHNYIEGALYVMSPSCVTLPVGTAVDMSTGNNGRIMLDKGIDGQRHGWSGNLYGALGDGSGVEQHQLVTAYFSPVVVEAPPAPAPEVVEPAPEPVVEPAADEPVVETAIAVPFNEQEVPSGEATPVPTTAEIIVEMVADAVAAVVETVVDVVTTVTENVSEAVTTVVKFCKDKIKGNNGWGNGDQAAPGNSASHNNAENSERSKHDGKKSGKKDDDKKSSKHDDDKKSSKHDDKKSSKHDDGKKSGKKDDDKKDDDKKSSKHDDDKKSDKHDDDKKSDKKDDDKKSGKKGD